MYTSTALPDGLQIDSNTGVISGTSTTVGTISVTVTATDNASPANTETKTITLC